MGYAEMVASKTVRELVAMKGSLDLSADEVGCFSADDPELLKAVQTELEKHRAETSGDYWGCQCEGFHLHAKDQEKCPVCGAQKVDSPDPLAVHVEEELQKLIRAIQSLKYDDVCWVLNNALPPEMKTRLACPPQP